MRHTFRLGSLVIVFFVALTACSPAATSTPIEPLPPTVVPATSTPVPTVLAALTNTPVVPPTLVPTATRTAQDLAAELDTFLQKLTDAGIMSGAVLAARDGQLILSKGYGLADRDKKIPNTAQTRYRIYSITKQFTAMAILMLQEQGKLNVQDPICKYIPDCPTAWKEVTIHHLLTHTSGIPDFMGFSDYQETSATPSPPAQTMARFKDKPLDFQPGEKWSYSNSGYLLLGSIIEQVSGQSYEDFLQKNIFEPLKMVNTGYDHSRTDLAIGYTNRTDIKAKFVDMSIPYAAGGLYSTVEDLYRWDQALYAEQLVPQKALDAMFTPHAAIPESGGLNYGYGWFVGQWLNRSVVFHPGGLVGYTSLIDRYPDDKVTVIVLSNQESLDPSTISDNVEKKIFGEK
jgi:CubicO group peptidase (beta-lactamase class C family)